MEFYGDALINKKGWVCHGLVRACLRQLYLLSIQTPATAQSALHFTSLHFPPSTLCMRLPIQRNNQSKNIYIHNIYMKQSKHSNTNNKMQVCQYDPSCVHATIFKTHNKNKNLEGKPYKNAIRTFKKKRYNFWKSDPLTLS